ncbi:hypothetical protein THUN1379_26810 [Paludibacterium sp. THUN1379]|uniref:hypothetical protein n=1 Tax=Paludibacterium sp. THUN1379 TaxID=3112107 RepID=UPI0030929B8A|nr:hypothetical protein THUN1379_26810 [Paludibacterium sp. THUN1379]
MLNQLQAIKLRRAQGVRRAMAQTQQRQQDLLVQQAALQQEIGQQRHVLLHLLGEQGTYSQGALARLRARIVSTQQTLQGLRQTRQRLQAEMAALERTLAEQTGHWRQLQRQLEKLLWMKERE